MKTTLLVFIGCLSLFAYRYSISCGNDQPDCQQSSCVESQNYCQCADVNAGKNPCISKSDYCRLFGNVGDNQLPDWPESE